MAKEIKLPALGEGIDTATVVSVLVSSGDAVEVDQGLIEVETEKATAEVPAAFAGEVKKILVKAGQTVRVGDAIAMLEPRENGKTAGAVATAKSEAAAPAEAPAPPAEERENGAAGEQTAAAVAAPPVPRAEEEEAGPRETAREGRELVPAGPTVRRIARELGLDIARVPGSGPGGRILSDDVFRHARKVITGRTAAGGDGRVAEPPLPDFSQWGEVERQPLEGVRRRTAENMALSWSTIPHVTQHDRADVTELERWRKEYGAAVEKEGGKLTMTAIAIRVAAQALRVFPRFNTSLDLASEEVIFKNYVHIGVAVDTERGLLVPVIRDADLKNITEIAVELQELAGKARSKRISPDEMRGASFNVSNLGGLGTTTFSPIIAWTHAAVLGLGRAETQAVWREGEFHPRLILPLSVSYDHRLVDGAAAARFLRWIGAALEHPMLMALQG